MFHDQLEACKEVERDLWELGITVKNEKVQSKEIGEAGWTKELYGYTYSIPLSYNANPADVFRWAGLDVEKTEEYIVAEWLDRESGEHRNPGNSWLKRRNYWEPHLESAFDGSKRFSYTYAERLLGTLREVVTHLKQERYSRQAIVSIWDRGIDTKRIGVMRVPCSIYYHFLIREEDGMDKINLIYNMRSCDLYTHFPIDQDLAIRIGQWVGYQIGGVDVGRLIHQIGSLHAFYPDLKKRGVF